MGFKEDEKGKRRACFVVVQFELIFRHPCFYVVCACIEFFGEVGHFPGQPISMMLPRRQGILEGGSSIPEGDSWGRFLVICACIEFFSEVGNFTERSGFLELCIIRKKLCTGRREWAPVLSPEAHGT